jgi:hypothetical protein
MEVFMASIVNNHTQPLLELMNVSRLYGATQPAVKM